MKILLLALLPLVVAAASGSEVVAKVAVPGTPCGVAGSPGAVWVTNALLGRLVRIDPATNTVTKQVATDTTPCEARYAAGSLWVITQSGRLDRFDPSSGRRWRRSESGRRRTTSRTRCARSGSRTGTAGRSSGSARSRIGC